MGFEQRNMFWRFGKKKKNGNEKKSLLKSIEQTEGGQAFENMSGGFPDLITANSEVSNKKSLNFLKKILSETSYPEDIDSEVVDGFPQKSNFEVIDEFVERNFPKLPEEGTKGSQLKQLREFLKSAESQIYNDVLRLTPALKDTGLLDHLINNYFRLLFTKLDLLLNRNLSGEETFCLLRWGNDVFFSSDSKVVFRVCDPLLLTGWFERAKVKLLPELQDEISRRLQNILDYDQHHRNQVDEETFIRVHLDVSQCLNAVITNSKDFSDTLMCLAQNICLQELHHFVEMYVHSEKKHIEKLQPLSTKHSVYLLRVISTCRQLRFLAPQFYNQDTNKTDDLLNIICMLQKMEDQVLSLVQKMMKEFAQATLRRYFKHGDLPIHILTEEIRNHCASLPQTDVGKEIREIFVNVVYDCVSRVYLDCLMKSKRKRLEKTWGDVGERIKEDAAHFHITFTQLNGSDDQNNQLLKRMSEVLCCDDIEALKLDCGSLFKDFPDDSQQYVPGLLRWKGTLSKRQVRKVLKVRDLDLDANSRDVACHPLKALCCCI
ncbi:uncharacterized protein si:dkey-196h17.9 isoform X2 [Danio rerio]|uniref:Uncharacterized protein si:dkey-196h17.9 isoform X2 n=1 Tax=Danio rerio TaxID=7955 RepID=A0AC58H437_DANRE|nr:uncharacterized protein si:dkey-196h17.9 isoform X2 [Danio rerio]|eukprot:XP_009305377.1 uncharacterized protein si:dkey-196h17.9 isoform X2 [Danio rerio]